MKQLIKNAKIYDGSGTEPFPGDVLLEDDRIKKLGSRLDGEDLKTCGRAIRVL